MKFDWFIFIVGNIKKLLDKIGIFLKVTFRNFKDFKKKITSKLFFFFSIDPINIIMLFVLIMNIVNNSIFNHFIISNNYVSTTF